MSPSSQTRPKPDLSFTKPPKSRIAYVFWRYRMWFESTFVLSMLEPWEKILLLMIIMTFFVLFSIGLVKYFPQHLSVMHRRAMYYLWGQEGDERLLWQWLGLGVGAGARKEL